MRLGHHIEVADATRNDRADWRKLNEAELDELIAYLVRAGDRLEASELLVRRRGCSTTEAHQSVEELDARL